MTMTLVSTYVASTAIQAITFSAIPQTGTDLLIAINLRTNNDGQFAYIALNGSSPSTFDSRDLFGTGSAVSTNTRSDTTVQTLVTPVTWGSQPGNVQIYIPNYSSTSAFKTVSFDAVLEQQGSQGYQAIKGMVWSNTSAISSISFQPASGTDFLSGSTISLYTITKGNGGATTSSS